MILAAERLGVPVVLLALVLLALWRGAVWTGDHVIMPMVNRQILFIDRLEESVQKIGHAVETSERLREEMVTSLNNLQQTAAEQTRILKGIEVGVKQ